MAVETREEAVAEVLAREAERCRAISQGDWAALGALLRDDDHHTHATSVVQDRPTYLAHIRARPRATTRGELRVQMLVERRSWPAGSSTRSKARRLEPRLGLSVICDSPLAFEQAYHLARTMAISAGAAINFEGGTSSVV